MRLAACVSKPPSATWNSGAADAGEQELRGEPELGAERLAGYSALDGADGGSLDRRPSS